ncbi:hypothetical protein ABIC89_001018 [Variovorax boronicumulans]|uniref:hypothetical protein n=1 Tax=Variovorax boronicumulans TaxID=436515 RepID=UPI00339B644A
MPTPSMQINPRLEDERAAFEADAAPMGFDLKRLSCLAPEPWSEYADESTGHRWGGWLARATSTRESCPLTIAQIHDCARDAQIDFCMEKESSFEVAFARRIEKVRAALNGADAGVSEGWQDIATAPKDGTPILAWSYEYGSRETYWRLYGDGSIARADFLAGKGPSGAWEWSEPQNRWAASWRPTHWQTLPSAPTQGGSHA